MSIFEDEVQFRNNPDFGIFFDQQNYWTRKKVTCAKSVNVAAVKSSYRRNRQQEILIRSEAY